MDKALSFSPQGFSARARAREDLKEQQEKNSARIGALLSLWKSDIRSELKQKLESLAKEPNEIESFRGLLHLGIELKRDGDYQKALTLCALVQRESPDAALRRQALLESNAIEGVGSSAYRSEVLLGSLVREGTDHRVILPMLAGSVVGQVARAATASRLASTAEATWLTRGLGAQFRAGATALAFEVPIFTAAQRALSPAHGSLSDDLSRSALSLSAFKLAGWSGGKLLPKVAPHSRFAAGLLQPATTFIALSASHRLEEGFGLRKTSPGSTWFLDTLGAMLSLGVGAHLSNRVLGDRFAVFQHELAVRLENTAGVSPSIVQPFSQLAPIEGAIQFVSPHKSTALAPGKFGGVMMAVSHDGLRGGGSTEYPHVAAKSFSFLGVQFATELVSRKPVHKLDRITEVLNKALLDILIEGKEEGIPLKGEVAKRLRDDQALRREILANEHEVRIRFDAETGKIVSLRIMDGERLVRELDENSAGPESRPSADSARSSTVHVKVNPPEMPAAILPPMPPASEPVSPATTPVAAQSSAPPTSSSIYAKTLTRSDAIRSLEHATHGTSHWRRVYALAFKLGEQIENPAFEFNPESRDRAEILLHDWIQDWADQLHERKNPHASLAEKQLCTLEDFLAGRRSWEEIESFVPKMTSRPPSEPPPAIVSTLPSATESTDSGVALRRRPPSDPPIVLLSPAGVRASLTLTATRDPEWRPVLDKVNAVAGLLESQDAPVEIREKARQKFWEEVQDWLELIAGGDLDPQSPLVFLDRLEKKLAPIPTVSDSEPAPSSSGASALFLDPARGHIWHRAKPLSDYPANGLSYWGDEAVTPLPPSNPAILEEPAPSNLPDTAPEVAPVKALPTWDSLQGRIQQIYGKIRASYQGSALHRAESLFKALAKHRKELPPIQADFILDIIDANINSGVQVGGPALEIMTKMLTHKTLLATLRRVSLEDAEWRGFIDEANRIFNGFFFPHPVERNRLQLGLGLLHEHLTEYSRRDPALMLEKLRTTDYLALRVSQAKPPEPIPGISPDAVMRLPTQEFFKRQVKPILSELQNRLDQNAKASLRKVGHYLIDLIFARYNEGLAAANTELLGASLKASRLIEQALEEQGYGKHSMLESLVEYTAEYLREWKGDTFAQSYLDNNPLSENSFSSVPKPGPADAQPAPSPSKESHPEAAVASSAGERTASHYARQVLEGHLDGVKQLGELAKTQDAALMEIMFFYGISVEPSTRADDLGGTAPEALKAAALAGLALAATENSKAGLYLNTLLASGERDVVPHFIALSVQETAAGAKAREALKSLAESGDASALEALLRLSQSDSKALSELVAESLRGLNLGEEKLQNSLSQRISGELEIFKLGLALAELGNTAAQNRLRGLVDFRPIFRDSDASPTGDQVQALAARLEPWNERGARHMRSQFRFSIPLDAPGREKSDVRSWPELPQGAQPKMLVEIKSDPEPTATAKKPDPHPKKSAAYFKANQILNEALNGHFRKVSRGLYTNKWIPVLSALTKDETVELLLAWSERLRKALAGNDLRRTIVFVDGISYLIRNGVKAQAVAPIQSILSPLLISIPYGYETELTLPYLQTFCSNPSRFILAAIEPRELAPILTSIEGEGSRVVELKDLVVRLSQSSEGKERDDLYLTMDTAVKNLSNADKVALGKESVSGLLGQIAEWKASRSMHAPNGDERFLVRIAVLANLSRRLMFSVDHYQAGEMVLPLMTSEVMRSVHIPWLNELNSYLANPR